MARSDLTVAAYGTPIWELSRSGRELSVIARPEAIERWSLGARLASISLPLTTDRVAGPTVTRFFDNLLPEIGREEIAAEFDLPDADPFSLLGAIGYDCAGALTVGDRPSDAVVSPDRRPIDAAALDSLIRELPRRPLGLGDLGVRHSLAGLQGKLMLFREADGSWSQPIGGQPSTHILKPEPLDVPFGIAGNEVFCTRLARLCGLTDVDAELLEVRGRYVFVTSRFDRWRHGSVIERIHQEDLCQAFGRSRGDKYERVGERRLAEAARMLSRFASRGDVVNLVRIAAFNVAIGNTDAHSKNLAVLHLPNGDVRLAPVYDVACHVARAGQPTSLAMAVNGVASIHAVTAEDLAVETAGWKCRVSAAQARAIVTDVLELMLASLSAAEATVWVDEEVVELVAARTLRLLDGQSAGTAD